MQKSNFTCYFMRVGSLQRRIVAWELFWEQSDEQTLEHAHTLKALS
jgi:hypothetical protein